MDESWNKLKTYIFNLQKTNYVDCLVPTYRCPNKSIRAHSIQKKGVLDLLSENGHIYRIKNELDRVFWEREGINKATTFKGLCNKHDTEIFREIDSNPINLENPYHLFLLAYRSVLREMTVLIDGALRNLQGFRKKVSLGLLDDEEPSFEEARMNGLFVNAEEFYEIKRLFDNIYLSEELSKIKHKTIIIENIRPAIAISSIFTYAETKVKSEDTERIILNVYPENNSLIVVFSYRNTDEEYIEARISNVIESKGMNQLYQLSKMVLRNCYNFIVSPILYRSWDEDRKNIMLDFFFKTATQDLINYEDERLFLFWDK
ncbi:MAG: hypothetical protein U5O15_03695 [Candidatus Krumholzibacteriota bacterium]|nr:hypothetical protein [Candidatus Krumholzibacteriota bacterium]